MKCTLWGEVSLSGEVGSVISLHMVLPMLYEGVLGTVGDVGNGLKISRTSTDGNQGLPDSRYCVFLPACGASASHYGGPRSRVDSKDE